MLIGGERSGSLLVVDEMKLGWDGDLLRGWGLRMGGGRWWHEEVLVVICVVELNDNLNRLEWVLWRTYC